MNKLIVLLAIAFATLSISSCKEKHASKEESHEGHNHGAGEKHDEAKALTYKCQTDCENGKTYDVKGTCPVCKMELVEVVEKGHEGHDHSKDADHKDHNH